MKTAPRTGVMDDQGPSLKTRVAAVMVVLALAGLAAYTVFSGPTTVSAPSTGAGATKAAPSQATSGEEPAERGDGGNGR